MPAEFIKGVSPIDNDVITKTPEQMIAEVPVIEWSHGYTAICTGGGTLQISENRSMSIYILGYGRGAFSFY